jgi:hypothetical protein
MNLSGQGMLVEIVDGGDRDGLVTTERVHVVTYRGSGRAD